MKPRVGFYGQVLLGCLYLENVLCHPAEALLPHRSTKFPLLDTVDVKNPRAVQEACEKITSETFVAFFSNETLLSAVFEDEEDSLLAPILEGLLSNRLPSIPSSMIGKGEADATSSLLSKNQGSLTYPGDPFQIEHGRLKGIFKDFSPPLIKTADTLRLGWCGFIAVSLDMHIAQKRRTDEYREPTWTYSGGSPLLRMNLARRNVYWEYSHLLWATKWLQDYASEWGRMKTLPSCSIEMYLTNILPLVQDYLIFQGSLGLQSGEGGMDLGILVN